MRERERERERERGWKGGGGGRNCYPQDSGGFVRGGLTVRSQKGVLWTLSQYQKKNAADRLRDSFRK